MFALGPDIASFWCSRHREVKRIKKGDLHYYQHSHHAGNSSGFSIYFFVSGVKSRWVSVLL